MKNWLKTKSFVKMWITLIRFYQKKFKTVLNESFCWKIEVPENILKHSRGSKSLYQYVKVVDDFETMFVKLDEVELKLEQLRKKRINHIL